MTFIGLCFSSETEFQTHTELYVRPMSSDILIFTLSSEHFKRRVTSFPSSFVYHGQGQIQTLQPTRNGFDRSMSLVQMCRAFPDLAIPSNHTKACTFLEVDGDQTLSCMEILQGQSGNQLWGKGSTFHSISVLTIIIHPPYDQARFLWIRFSCPLSQCHSLCKLCYIIVMAASKYQCV